MAMGCLTSSGTDWRPSNLIHVLLAQPNGGYTAAPTVRYPVLSTAYCRLFDTNRDGKLDLVCPYENTFSASIVVLPGNGDGTFSAPVFTALPTSNGNYFDASSLCQWMQTVTESLT